MIDLNIKKGKDKMLKTKCQHCKEIIECLEDECCPICGLRINIEDVPKERCPECKRELTWIDEYYCIEGRQSTFDTFEAHNLLIIRHYCTCGRQVAVQMDTNYGSEVFINSENIDY